MAAMSVVGVAVSVYLTVVHYSGAALVCTQGGLIDCEAVTTSSYSVVPGTLVPISLAGLLWFVVSGSLAVVGTRSDATWPRAAHLAWTAAGVAVVLYLVNAELAVIGRICEWCTVLHVLIVATFFVALARFRDAVPEG